MARIRGQIPVIKAHSIIHNSTMHANAIGRAERVELVNRIFSEALDLPSSERSGFVGRECSSDPSIGASVLKLLSEYGRLGTFLDTPAFAQRAVSASLAVGDVVAGR